MLRRTILILLAFALPAWGAMDFDGVTDKAESSSAEVTATPLTLCVMGKHDTDTARGTPFALVRAANVGHRFWTLFRGDTTGDPLGAVTTAGSGDAIANTSSGYTATMWHRGCYVYSASNSRAAYIDGGAKGTDTTNRVPSGIDKTAVANLGNDSNWFDGSLAELGLWNVALTDENVDSFTDGTNHYAAHCIRPEALVGNYPMIRDSGSLKDHAGEPNNLTLTGGTVSTHPRVTNCQ